jgi:hypothetical protein
MLASILLLSLPTCFTNLALTGAAPSMVGAMPCARPRTWDDIICCHGYCQYRGTFIEASRRYVRQYSRVAHCGQPYFVISIIDS